MRQVNLELFDAIEWGKFEKVKELFSLPDITERPNINETSERGFTPFIAAARHNQVDIMEFLLNQGANIEDKDKNGLTAIHAAASLGNIDAVKFLLDHNADCTGLDNKEKTPLMYAISEEQEEIVKLLLEKGNTDINAKGKRQNTALHWAADYGNIAITEYLLTHGADIEATNRSGVTPVFYAVKGKNQKLIECFVKHNANMNVKDNDGKSLLHWTVLHHPVETPFSSADPILEYLLQFVDIETKDKYGYTPLLDAVTYPPNVEILLQHGANVNATNSFGQTALMRSEHNLKSAQILLEYKADLNLRDRNGNTALLHAVYPSWRNSETTNVAKCLIKHGADITITNDKGESAVEWATQHAQKEMLHYISRVWKKKKELSVQGLNNLQNKPDLLKKLLITGKLLKRLKEQPYEEQVKIYHVAKQILPPQSQKEFEESIRSKRLQKGKE